MEDEFKKFRKFVTSSGFEVVAGKSQEQNEELVPNFFGKENILLHTVKPGSPFSVVLNEGKIPKKDLYEVAVFTARYSQDWRDNKSNVEVHYFDGKNVYKNAKMKVGTFGVKKCKTIKVKKSDILRFENETD